MACFTCAEEKVQEIMTADEKQKLYDAIGYEENMTSDLPKEVCFKSVFSYNRICLGIAKSCHIWFSRLLVGP